MIKNVIAYLVFSALVLTCNNASAQQSANRQKPTLNHIAIYVVDLQKSTDFYTRIVQLDTIPEPFHDGKHTWFAVGPLSHLHLIQGATGFTGHEKNSHLCFTVASVPEFIKVLETNKIEYENWIGEKYKVTKRVDNVNQIYFKDPDGYWLEINDARR